MALAEAGAGGEAGAVAVASKVPISYVEFFGACSHDAVAASTSFFFATFLIASYCSESQS